MGKLQMTQEGYNKKMEEFNRIKQKLKQTSRNKIESAYDGSGDTWHDNFTYEQLDLQEEGLLARLENMQEELSNTIIIKRENFGKDLVNIGDKVLVIINYFNGDSEELILTLDDGSCEENAVTLNSPLGKVLYKAEIGKEYEYTVNNQTNKVLVKKKYNT